MEAHQEGTKTISPSLQNSSSFSTQEDAKELKYCLSSPHTVKGFADDLSVFSSNISEHQSLLSDLSTYSQDLDLILRPDKCVSVIFNGNKMDHKITFSLALDS